MVPSASAPPSDLRRTVLDAALAIIDTQGPDAVSMREVARRAGVSHQAPYHYFSDRAGIFAAISEEGFLGLAEAFHATLATTQNPARDGLRTYLTFALSHRGHFRVMFRNDICGIRTHEQTEGAADQAFNALLTLVIRVVNDKPGKEETMVWASTLWSVAHGLATLVIDGPLAVKLARELGPEAVDEHLDHVIDLFSTMVSQQARTLFPENS
jgi:AcrR family transcriptional regulator